MKNKQKKMNKIFLGRKEESNMVKLGKKKVVE